MVIPSSRACWNCEKAEAFCAEAFSSGLWKSSRRSRRRPPLSISTAAAVSTGFLSFLVLFSFFVEVGRKMSRQVGL